ncbi:MAG: NTP transferase domain-containing protein [Nitrosarchaeum sp.]|nr:NTP transferase domain-containing protein [Nitrosarchaeum sp.]
MKAIILAGGKGTRGKPYTEYFPKAMTPINDKPLIDYIVKYLSSFDFIKEIIIISDYTGLGGQIKNYYSNPKNGKKITFVQDTQSGTGGDLLHIEDKLKGDSEFVLWFVDNLCAIDLVKMRKVFKEKNSVACIATRTKRKEETGFAVDILQQLSKEGKISAYDIGDKEWIDAESPMVLERNKIVVKKIIKQMGF